jgi:hypothetical protein
MKILILLWLTLALLGCATAIPYTAEEQCALGAMHLVGLDFQSGSSHAVASNGRSAVAHSYGTAVRCETPKSEAESSHVAIVRQSLDPKIEYNNAIGGKRLMTGIGYVLWIVPGIGLKLYFDSEYDNAVEQSYKIRSELSSGQPRTPAVQSESKVDDSN